MVDQARTQINGNVADALAAVQRLTDSLNLITSERSQVQQRVQASQAKIDSLNGEIARLDAEIDATQRRIEGERAEIAVMARQLYQEPDSLLLRLLQAGSVRDMVTQTSDLTAAALHADSLRQHLSDDLTRLNQDQAAEQQARDTETQTQAQLSDALSQFQDLAVQEQQTSDALLGFIHDGRDALAGAATQAADLAQQVAATLQDREQQLIASAEQQVWQQEQLWATLNASAIPRPVAVTISRPAGAAARFGWPILGATLTQGFGPTTLWLEPAMLGFPHFHTGLDLASPNTRVAAAADGLVATVGAGTTGYGNYVIVVHRDGFVTLYGHLAVTTVSAGQTVTQGQEIGVEGSTGASTGVHLHFEVRLNGTPVDPSPYLPGGGTA
jgi:murein DD-endopeptidase MepM/ murein hydrolase activator NlpD